jgi:hypothetical protein
LEVVGVGWWSDARHAAAHEFGRRHYRGIATFVALRHVLPAVVVVLAAGVLAWAGWRFEAYWVAHWREVVPAVVIVAALAVAVWVWRRWGEIIGGLLELMLPVEHVGAWALVAFLVIGGGGFAAVWFLVT